MENLLKKLVLGTVQFGLDYGINNFKGKPDREKSLMMLDLAFKKGITIYDTAYAYGDAEEILGEFSASRKLGEKIKIITKLKPNLIEETPGDISGIITANLQESLKRLKRNFVDGYLLHTPEYIRNEKIVAALGGLKKQGLVKNIGVSIYEEADAVYAAKLNEVDYIQIPYSIFDQRLEKTDFFQLARKNNKTVFARSAFLQGLFFMPEEKIPDYLNNAKAHLKELDKTIFKHGFSRQQAALLFSLKNKNIDYTVFGVDNIGQLEEDLNLAENAPDVEACLKELKDKFANIEKNIIFPSLWKR